MPDNLYCQIPLRFNIEALFIFLEKIYISCGGDHGGVVGIELEVGNIKFNI